MFNNQDGMNYKDASVDGSMAYFFSDSVLPISFFGF